MSRANFDGRVIRARFAELELAPQLVPRSVVHAEAQTYAASAADFDWRMSRAEMKRLAWLLEQQPAEYEVGHRVFYRIEDEWEAVIHLSTNRAVFQWHFTDASCTGAITFHSGKQALDRSLVIDICRSFDPTRTEIVERELGEVFIDGKAITPSVIEEPN